MLSSSQLHNAVSQGDYVIYQETCASNLTRLPRTVIGVRMEGDNRAIVREEVMAFKNSVTMVYEDGRWVQAPSDFWIQHGGLPVDQIIAEQRSTGRCGKDLPQPTLTSSPPTTRAPSRPPSTPGATSPAPPPPHSPPPTDASTSDVSVPPSTRTAHLSAVRMGPRDGYDRLVLEFSDLVPGYTVGYRPLPMQHDASGAIIPLSGANAAVRITLRSAVADSDVGNHDYHGPSTITADTGVVTEAKMAGDFEAVLTWVVGLRAEVPFRVLVLDGPPRLVIDFHQ